MSKITTGLIKESLLIRFNKKLKLLEQVLEHYQISKEDASDLYRLTFSNFAGEIDNFCFLLIWNRKLSKDLSKEARRSFMRKMIWELRCKGIVFEDSDLVS